MTANEPQETTTVTTPTGVVVGAAVTPTQVRRPWRSTIRTVFQAAVAAAAAAPLVYQAATQDSPELATGAAGAFLAVSAGVTRVMALPVTERFLRRFLPFLAAAPKPKG
ncbi:hypothetical protein [Nocardioides sp.]|uniref:hypothetical protein n=1 Tax=Nocardioides sp. TaxID=35761 RepID=UPI002636F0E1|nr:hypothetical protein [Nocardioides sp.]MDI6911496.1 hypothetical protein [Nocardioides sp.]